MTIDARLEVDDADRRDASRRRLRLGVAGRFAREGSGAVTVHNISATGLLLETSAELVEGDSLVVELPHAGETPAQVVWANAPMFGCQFAQPISGAALSAAQLQGEPADEPVLPEGEDFGQRLHRLRRERGLSLGEIAARLGVSKPTVWAWEHGKSRPVERRLVSLAEVLGVTPGGLEPATGGTSEELEHSRRRIAQAYGVEPGRVRIMIEL